MSRSIRLSTLAGALLGAFGVAVFAGDLDALAAGLDAWAGVLQPGLALALVAGGAVGGGILAQSLVPRRRRRKTADGGGPSWALVLGLLGVVAVLYGKAFGEPLRAAVGKVVALMIGDGSA